MAVHQQDRNQKSGSKKGLWVLLAVLAVVAIVVAAFFLLGGDADVDTEGGNVDVETPDVDADVNAPDVDADVDADLDVQDGGDADADAGDDDQ